MPYNPQTHHRRSIRLQGYDYTTPGAYFITLCTHQRQCLFGDIVDGQMQLNAWGRIVADEWLKSATIRQEIELDEWVVMPNHFHGIVFIQSIETDRSVGANGDSVGANGRSPLQVSRHDRSPQPGVAPSMQPRSLSSLIAGFKSATTKHINIARKAPGTPVWQRNYDHIIRNEDALHQIRDYVQTNPCRWEGDRLHPAFHSGSRPSSFFVFTGLNRL